MEDLNSILVSGQLWKIHQFQLESKEGIWISMWDEWKFIEAEKLHSVYIENSSKEKVLEATKDGKVILEVKDEDKDEQLWKKGVPDNEGYFTLENEHGKVLTAISSFDLEIKGNMTLR